MHCTTCGKHVHCQYLDIDITITGIYNFRDPEKPTIGYFSYATCPIVENSKLPRYQQSDLYSHYKCPNNCYCDLLHQFAMIRDFSDGNYCE